MTELRLPKEQAIELADGTEKTFTLTKFDAIAGREIVVQYPTSGLPKIGDYTLNEELMFKLMAYVYVRTGEGPTGPLQALSSPDMIKNHVPDWEALMRLEWAMMEYNCSFFAQGKVSNFLDGISEKLPKLILSILTPLLEQSFPKSSPPSPNSERSTH